MIYHILLVIFRFALKQYFKHISVYFEKPLPKDRPILFVANHQSAFMDALVIGAQLDKQLHFVSRGESFDKSWKRWILSQFNMHPIYRKEFTPGLTQKNPAAIQAFQSLLIEGKSILIFPEGISKTAPRLSEVKTGAARIALGAYAACISKEAPIIIPIGLNYTNPHQFRSDVIINFGAAIDLEKYSEQFLNDERAAVQSLTDKIANELERLTLVIPETELEAMIGSVKSFYEEELLQEEHISQAQQWRVFNVRKEMIGAARYFNEHFPFRFRHMNLHIEHYRKLLLNYEVEDNWLRPSKNPDRQLMASNIIFLLISFPIFLFGFANHIIAMLFSRWLANKSIQRPDFKGSMLLSFGVLFCIICYAAQTIGVYYLSMSWETSLLYLITLPMVGKFSLSYSDFYGKVRTEWQRHYFQQSGEDVIAYLKKERTHLIRLLSSARKDYLAVR